MGAQRCVFWGAPKRGLSTLLRWWNSVGEESSLRFWPQAAGYFPLCPVFISFYVRQPTVRKDEMMGREGGRAGSPVPFWILQRPSEKKSPSSAVSSQPVTAPVRVKQFLWFVFGSFSALAFRVTCACQIPQGGCYCLVRWQLHDANEEREWWPVVALVAAGRQHLHLPDPVLRRPCSLRQVPAAAGFVFFFFNFLLIWEQWLLTIPPRSCQWVLGPKGLCGNMSLLVCYASCQGLVLLLG